MAAVDSDVTPTTRNEVQTLVLSSWDASDTIKLTWDGTESSAVTQASDCTTAFQAAIDQCGAGSTSYQGYVPGDIVVSRTNATTYVFTFSGASVRSRDVSAITATNGTGSATGAVTETTKGDSRGQRTKFELLETIAITNQSGGNTKNRAVAVPAWAKGFTLLLDITITGTTPLMDLTISGATTAGGRRGATLDSTTDKFEFTAGGPITITQLTTDTSTPIVSIAVGPGVQTDTSGSATANSAYAFSCAGLPTWLIYTYILDGTTGDEDYNGTISIIWHS